MLKENHHPPEGLQQKIATSPRYYAEDIERLQKDIKEYDIRHIAILFGPAGINDQDGSSLVLHGLDTDGEIFDKDERKEQIIEDLKTKTIVIKTGKAWGNLIIWFEHSRHHKSIKTTDCMDQFHCFELKCQNNARTDVPPSTHRNDEKFHYYHVGLDKVAILDGLYDKLVDEDLSDCILSEQHPYSSKRSQKGTGNKTYGNQFYSLSEETISALVPLAAKYYIEGNHDKFTFQFCGMMWHASIDMESATSVIVKICQRAGDSEKLPKRIDTIKDTYARGSKGLTVAGTTEFIKLVQHLASFLTRD